MSLSSSTEAGTSKPRARDAHSQYGRGSVDQLPSGRWRVRVRLPDGTRVNETCATREEAEHLRATLVVARNDDARVETNPAPVAGVATLATFGEGWLVRRRTLKTVRWRC